MLGAELWMSFLKEGQPIGSLQHKYNPLLTGPSDSSNKLSDWEGEDEQSGALSCRC